MQIEVLEQQVKILKEWAMDIQNSLNTLSKRIEIVEGLLKEMKEKQEQLLNFKLNTEK